MEDYLAGNIFPVMNAAIYLGGYPLIVGTVVGFIIAIFQAVTSIQDQSLPQTVKIVVLVVMLTAMFQQLASPLYVETLRLFTHFPELVG